LKNPFGNTELQNNRGGDHLVHENRTACPGFGAELHLPRTVWLLTSGVPNSVTVFFHEMYKLPNVSIYLLQRLIVD